MGYSPLGCKELDTTERLTQSEWWEGLQEVTTHKVHFPPHHSCRGPGENAVIFAFPVCYMPHTLV